MNIILFVLKNVKDTKSFNPNNLSLEDQYHFNHPFDLKNKIKLESDADYDVCDFVKLHGSGSSLHLLIDYGKIPDHRNFQIFINGVTRSNDRIEHYTTEGLLKQNDFLEIVFKDAKGTSLTHINIFVIYIAQKEK